MNTTNHDPAVADAVGAGFIGFHAYPTNGGYSPDPSTFKRMFDYADTLLATVARVDAVIAALSPSTRTVLDETGTDMDGVLAGGLSPPGDNPRYWVASAGYWAYIYARAANESSTVVQVGASQFMDAPGQEPSVSMVDWATGLGTARFWAVRLLIESLSLGDSIVATTASAVGNDADALFAMGFAGQGQGLRQLLLINKRNAFASVALRCGGGVPCTCSSYKVIDEANGLSPARTETCDSSGTVLLAPYALAVVLIQ